MKNKSKNNLFLFTILFTILVAISLQASFAAGEVTVGEDGVDTISDALFHTNEYDVIKLTPDTYTGSDNIGLSINRSLTIQGNGPRESVTLDAGSDDRIFMITENDLNVKFINLTFTDGNNNQGGAVYINGFNTNVTFINCVFENNYANYEGGAIFVKDAYLNISGCKFISNEASWGNGGAIYYTNCLNSVVENSIFISNEANNGGAIYNNRGYEQVGEADAASIIASSGEISIMEDDSEEEGFLVKNTTFVNNYGRWNGGAIYNNNVDNYIVEDSKFISNFANYGGGAIYNYNDEIRNEEYYYGYSWGYEYGWISTTIKGSNFNVKNSIFIKNNANNGGAIYNDKGNNFKIEDSYFTKNIANNGGAIYNYGSTYWDSYSYSYNYETGVGSEDITFANNGIGFTITNTNFTKNKAYQDGGAIYNDNGDSFTVMYSNFTNNKAYQNGGAIYNQNGYGHPGEEAMAMSLSDGNLLRGGISLMEDASQDKCFRVINSNFTNNKAYQDGGAIYNNGEILQKNYGYDEAGYHYYFEEYQVKGSNFIVDNCNFTDNKARQYGGAIYNNHGDNFTVFDSNFTNNKAKSGGAIYNYGEGYYQSYWNVYDWNWNPVRSGYGDYLKSGSGFTVINTEFNENKACLSGGSIYNNNGEDFTVTESTFTENTAKYGSAIFNNNDGSFEITDSEFTANTAIKSGTIFNWGDMYVSGNTMEDNEAELGAEIFNLGNMGILNLTYLNNKTVGVYANSFATINATLTDDMGNTVTGGFIIFFIDESYYKYAFSREGYIEFEYEVGDVEAGTIIPVTGCYIGRCGYAIDIYSGELKVLENTYSTIEAPETKVGNNATITGNATDAKDEPLKNIDGVTVIIIDDEGTVVYKEITSTNEDGEWTINYPTDKTGDFKVIVKWAGDGETYTGFKNCTTLTVSPKIDTTTTINVPGSGETKIEDAAEITGVATEADGETPLATKNITVIITDNTGHNTTYTNVQTDSEGNWVINHPTTIAGTHNVTVKWDGNNTHNGFEVYDNFDVKDKTATITTITTPENVKIPALSDKGNSMEITGVLKDANGNLIKNKTITVTIGDNSPVTVTTDDNGKWTAPYTPTKTGTINIIANFAGDEDYKASSDTSSFNVTKGKIFVKITVTDNDDGSVTITANVTTDDGDPVANYPVDFYMDGKKIGTKNTDVNGIASITIPGDGKEHEYKVLVPDAEIHENSENSIIHTPQSSEEDEEGDDDTDIDDTEDDNQDDESETPSAGASMKNTGIPIVVLLLVLLSCLGIINRKK